MNSLKIDKKVLFVCISLFVITLIIIVFNLINDNMINEDDVDDTPFLKDYKINEYIPLDMEDEDIVKIYFNDFRNYMLTNVEEAYELLNREYRSKRFGNLDGFKKYVDEFISISFISVEVDKYSVSRTNGNKIFYVYDKNGFQYIFKENSIMNYEVYLDEYTVEVK